jgi:hypothetical protein
MERSLSICPPVSFMIPLSTKFWLTDGRCHRATGNSTKSSVNRSVPSWSRLCQPRHTTWADTQKEHSHWVQDCSCGYWWCRVRAKKLAGGFALTGLRKSQLSIEYSYRIRCQSSETWVFWVYASNAARFEQSFWEIANRLKLPGRRDPAVNIFQLVENWLQDERKGKWLLILDNVDDDKFLRQPPAASEPSANSQQGLNTSQAKALTKPLINFIPQTSNGSIIITSWSQDVCLEPMAWEG